MIKKNLMIITVFLFGIFVSEGYALKLDFSSTQDLSAGMQDKRTNKEVQVIVRPKVEYKAQGLRNPFEQPVLNPEAGQEVSVGTIETKPLPSLTVQGVIWGSGLPQAIINNKVVKSGDILDGAEVFEINKEGVTVMFAGVEYKLSTLPALGQQENLKQ